MLRQYKHFEKHFEESKAGLSSDVELQQAQTQEEKTFARMKKVVEEMAG